MKKKRRRKTDIESVIKRMYRAVDKAYDILGEL